VVLERAAQASQRVTADQSGIWIEQKNKAAAAGGEALVAGPSKPDVVAVHNQLNVGLQAAHLRGGPISAGIVDYNDFCLNSFLVTD
jgi:hypothetical protein